MLNLKLPLQIGALGFTYRPHTGHKVRKQPNRLSNMCDHHVSLDTYLPVPTDHSCHLQGLPDFGVMAQQPRSRRPDDPGDHDHRLERIHIPPALLQELHLIPHSQTFIF